MKLELSIDDNDSCDDAESSNNMDVYREEGEPAKRRCRDRRWAKRREASVEERQNGENGSAPNMSEKN